MKKFPSVQLDSVICSGGLDQITPTLSLKNGVARYSVNFAPSLNGGYERTGEYERYDGHTSPSSSSNTYQVISVSALTNTPNIGDTLTGSSSGATGVVVWRDGLRIAITKRTLAFTIEPITVGATPIGTIDGLDEGPNTTLEDATIRNAMADIYRADISAVPGTGGILGVVMLNNVVYAFRNKADGTICEGYRSSAAGWVKLTGSLTASRAIEFVVGSVGAGSVYPYGANGADYGFYINTSTNTITAINSAGAPSAPDHIAIHVNRLWMAQDAHLYYSDIGAITWAGDAGEIGVDDTRKGTVTEGITALLVLPGGTSTPTMAVFTRDNTFLIYGATTTEFNLASFNTGTGANPGTCQNMSQTIAFDDRGIVSIQAALQYGNFVSSTLTPGILPFIKSHNGLATCATLIRNKAQYRVFFSNGDALACTIVNGKSLGVMPLYYAKPVSCVWEGKTLLGEDVVYFGSTDGMVYQMDKGTSADGANIEWSLVLNYSNARSPRTKKRYKKAALEVSSYDSSYIEMWVGHTLGYDSPEYWQPNSENYSLYLSRSRWDLFTWDNWFWDSRGIEPVEVELCGTAENIAISIYGESDLVPPFVINSIIMHYTPRRLMR